MLVGADYSPISNSEGGYYHSVSVNAGFGVQKPELHITVSDTNNSLRKFNVFDLADRAYIKIMEW